MTRGRWIVPGTSKESKGKLFLQQVRRSKEKLFLEQARSRRGRLFLEQVRRSNVKFLTTCSRNNYFRIFHAHPHCLCQEQLNLFQEQVTSLVFMLSLTACFLEQVYLLLGL